MSVSIDEDLADGGDEESRAVLASWLDDYSDGRCEIEDLREAITSVCQRDSDAPWEALALLDQYTRRNRITADVAQSLKADIEKLVFGQNRRPPPPAKTQHAERSEPAASVRRPAPDSTSDLEPDDTAAPTLRRSVAETRTEPPLTRTEPPSTRTAEPPLKKLSAERDEPTTRPGSAFIDRTALRAIEDRSVDFEREAPTQPRRSPTIPAAVPAPRSGAAGRVLRDRYELLSVLGRGPTGTVYRAIDRRRMHLSESARCVAVKLLHENYSEQPAALAELEREFHQAQSLSHPNIVSVFDLDRDGDEYFVVMELLEGELLSSILRKLAGRSMRREHAFAIVGAVGSALAYAHGREIVHADLKPSAIMITSSGEVRVLDFGFARNRAFDLHTAAAPHETPAPSPAYASVERVNGSEPAVSDDVYSLACIAYELFTGQHPFGGRSALLARAHGRRPPRVRGFNHKQWGALQRALLWSRGERRIGVAELLDALEPATASAVRAAPEDIVTPPDERSRWLRVGAVAATIAAMVGAAVHFAPELLQRQTRVADAVPVSAPAADRELQAAPEAAPKSEDAESADAAPSQQPAKVAAASAPAADKPRPRQEASVSSQPERKSARPATPAPARDAAIQFDKDTYVTTEGDGSVKLQVTRDGSTRGSARFSWSIRGNSAEAGADFAAIGPVSEEIPAGAQGASLTIPLVADGLIENTELFLVELHPADGASLGERSHAAVIIVDDD